MSSTRSPDETNRSPADAATDRDLLTKFVRHADGEAFAAIVRRYSHLVLGVCRRVLHDRHAAEDAFQATFLVLAQSARRIRKQRSLSSWLHGVAYRISLRALAQRHRRREQPAVIETVTVEPALEHVGAAYEQQLLDQELQELPEQYRAPLVMHYLEGHSRQEIANRLGVSLSAVEGRLKRGKKELRLRLLRHGVPAGAVLAAVHIAQSTVDAAAISTLVAETTRAALAAASGTLTTSAATSNAAVLAGKELSTMAASKLLMTLGLSTAALALVLIGAGVAGTGGKQGAAEPLSNALALDAEFPGGIVETGDAGIGVVAQVQDADRQQQQTQEELRQLHRQILDLKNAMAKSASFQAADLKPRDKRTAAIEAALNTITTLEFPANPLGDVMEYLATIHNIPIVLDDERLSEIGLSRDQEVSLVISDITLQNALELLLDNVAGQQLDYVIQNQVLKITTREKADQTLETRVYSLRALENSGFDSYSVANVIRKTIEPASWAHIEIVPEPTGAGMGGMEGMMGMGGDMGAGAGGMAMPGMSGAMMSGMGSGMMGPGGLGAMQIDRKKSTGLGTIEALPGCLVITQSQRVHRAVADLLGQLRAQANEGASGGAGFDTGAGPAGMGGAGIGSPFGTVDPVGGTTAPTGGSSGAAGGAGPGAGAATESRSEERLIPDLRSGTGGRNDALTTSKKVRGTIRVQGQVAGRPPLVEPGQQVPDARHLTEPVPDESVLVGPGGGLANCLVFLDKPPEGVPVPPVPDDPARLEIDGLRFRPHSLAVRAGQTVQVDNLDPIACNIHAQTVSNPPVNFVVPPNKENALAWRLDRSERLPIHVKDDIHNWMSAHVLVLNHPWFAVTDEDGQFELPELPPGEHTLKVWHEAAGWLTQAFTLTVTPEGTPHQTLLVDATQLERH